MKLINAHIDYTKPNPNDLLLATTNNVVSRTGLIMGKGNALSMKDAYPSAPRLLGNLINDSLYGLVITDIPGGFIGGFQTKYNWQSPSTLDIIQFSTECLCNAASDFDLVHLPFPGISNGGLDKYEVLEVIHILPDNVLVYH